MCKPYPTSDVTRYIAIWWINSLIRKIEISLWCFFFIILHFHEICRKNFFQCTTPLIILITRMFTVGDYRVFALKGPNLSCYRGSIDDLYQHQTTVNCLEYEKPVRLFYIAGRLILCILYNVHYALHFYSVT